MRFSVLIFLAACRLGAAQSPCARTTECDAGLFCVKGSCAAATCSDGVRNGEETDVDCGGACAACSSGSSCVVGRDCDSYLCAAGSCTIATCTDAVKNGHETDVDCGGSCGACAPHARCATAADCDSRLCSSGICVASSCTDGVSNESESDIDCGGPACLPCAPQHTCHVAGDCDSGVCPNGVCAPAACDDLVKNGSESDVDCGGTCAAACALGKVCGRDADCASNVCEGGVCVDCRGAADCMRGTASAECVSYACTANACHATALLPAQIANDCTAKVCEADYSLTLTKAPTDVEADVSADCFAYTCSCDTVSCTKVVVFQSTDTPKQTSGDCHVEQCTNVTPLPHATNAVDPKDIPVSAPPCHSSACSADGSASYPVNTTNVEDDHNACTTDSCDSNGGVHHDVHAQDGYCSGLCGSSNDSCGVLHNCSAENDPCTPQDCGQKTNHCQTYQCPLQCTGDGEFCASNNRCGTRTGGSGGGTSGGTTGGTTGGAKPPCCNHNPPTCSDQC